MCVWRNLPAGQTKVVNVNVCCLVSWSPWNKSFVKKSPWNESFEKKSPWNKSLVKKNSVPKSATAGVLENTVVSPMKIQGLFGGVESGCRNGGGWRINVSENLGGAWMEREGYATF